MKIQKYLIAALLLLCSFISINAQVEQKNKTKSEEVYDVDANDEGMNAAIQKARKTFTEFEKAIKSKNPNFKNFTFKKAFPSDFGDEHIWIMYVMPNPKKNNYAGIIGNEPQMTKKVKFEDVVEVSKDEITDWMYYDNGKLRGAYTTKLLRSRMSPEERKAFDEETNDELVDSE